MSDQYLTQDQIRSNKIKTVSYWIIGIALLAASVWGVIKLAESSNKQLATNPGGIPAMSASDKVLGSRDAKAVLIEYADFQCPACKLAAPNLNQLVKDYPGKVAVVYRYFPLIQIHATAEISAQAAEAASMQGKFWEMHDLLFANQDTWANQPNAAEIFAGYAQQLGLNVDQFKKDLTSQEVVTMVKNAYDSAIALRLDHTPTIYLDGKEINVTADYQSYKDAVGRKLNE